MPHPNFIDLTKQKFNRLTVLKRVENNKWGEACWECQCFCGNIITTTGKKLRGGNTKSCGCLHKDIITTHGFSKRPEHTIWRTIKQRCLNTKSEGYKAYGGRGITICDEWKNSFKTFFKYIGPRPSLLHSIDRWPDNNGNYEPRNTRWATPREQSNNRRDNNLITINKKTLTVTQWARISGINVSTIRARKRRGWNPQKAIFAPVKHKI